MTEKIILSYKASNIAKAEAKFGKSFLTSLSTIGQSVGDLFFLFKAGGAEDEDFDNAMAQGIDQAILVIMKAVSDAGFLGVKLDTDQLEQELKSVMKTMESEIKTSLNTGAKVKV